VDSWEKGHMCVTFQTDRSFLCNRLEGPFLSKSAGELKIPGFFKILAFHMMIKYYNWNRKGCN
jgi:uncharacterized secreted protein with C-terminal beta-propeller domain